MGNLTDAQIAFKAAFRYSVKLAGGPSAAADATRVDAARLSRYGNIESPEMPPIDVCFDLDRAVGKPINLKAFADLSDFELAAKGASRRVRDITAAVGEVAKLSGELVSSTIEAEADGDTTPREAMNLHELGGRLDSAVVNFCDAVRPAMKTA